MRRTKRVNDSRRARDQRRARDPRRVHPALLLAACGLWFGALGCGGGGGEPAADGAGGPDSARAPETELAAEIQYRDVNGDGVDDTLHFYPAGYGGNESGRHRTEADTYGDGEIDFWAFVNPDTDLTEEIAYDTDADGNADTWQIFEGPRGRVVERWRDTNGDGRPDEWTVYGADRRVTEQRLDGNGDGEPDTWSTFRADGATLERVAYDTDSSGEPDRWLNYDTTGSLVSIQTDTDGDAIPDTIKQVQR